MLIDDLILNIPQNIDGILISSQENRKYFTGFSSTAGYLVVSRNNCVFLTDSRYIEEAANKITFCDVIEMKTTLEQISDICENFGISTLGIETNRVTVGECRKLYQKLKGVKLDISGSTDRLINDLRLIKLPWEVEYIRKAQQIAERSFDSLLSSVHPGMTEKEIAAELDYNILKNGADALSFDTIAVAGRNSSKPHGVPSKYPVERGDFLTLDFGAVVNGYHSDMTRTVAVSSVTSEQRRVYDTVLRAQEASLASIKEGMSCRDVDAAGRKIIENAGFGECFGHGIGHGVGIEVHEAPNLSPRSDDILHVGNVITVEPGIYIKGRFGVRIEDMGVVTQDGFQNLTEYRKDLIII